MSTSPFPLLALRLKLQVRTNEATKVGRYQTFDEYIPKSLGQEQGTGGVLLQESIVSYPNGPITVVDGNASPPVAYE